MAAAPLFRDDVPIEIVEAPPAFPDVEYEGLVVTADDWPPLLRPELLADPESYAAWERHMISRCADETLSPESAIATLERDAHIVRAVTPVTSGSIMRAIATLPHEISPARAPDTLDASLSRYAEVLKAVPDEWRPDPDIRELADVYRSHVRPHWTEWAGVRLWQRPPQNWRSGQVPPPDPRRRAGELQSWFWRSWLQRPPSGRGR